MTKDATDPSDAELTRRIVDVAAELFAEKGYGGTRLPMVAERADLSTRTVKRLTGGRAELFAQVMAEKLTSLAAERLAAAAADPDAEPPLAVLLEAAAEIFAAPERNWNVLELEALTRAHTDGEIRTLEAERLRRRWANMATVTRQARLAGGIDHEVHDDAFVHFALALSVGLAMVAPVVDRPPRQDRWNALMARIGSGIAPDDLLLSADQGARTPWRLRLDLPDRPGAMARLIRVLDTVQARVTSLSTLAADDDTRTIDLVVTMPGVVDGESLLAAGMAAGGNCSVTSASADDDLDLPTRLLDAAAGLITDPGPTPSAAETLLRADQADLTPATEGPDDAADVLRLQWTPETHLVLQRPWAPFTRTETTRASALLRLAAVAADARGDREALGWSAPIAGGGTIRIRLARPEDTEAVAAMHARCSEETLYRRYLTGVSEWHELTLRRLTGGHRGATLVVVSEEGIVVGLGHAFPDAPVEGEGRAADLAVLVEDAYQGRGIGTALTRLMLELAPRLGFEAVVGTVLAQNARMLRVLEATGLAWTRSTEEGVVTLRAPLPRADDAPPR